MFEAAIRAHLRFATPKGGKTSVEDLWDLSLEDLNKTFQLLNADKKAVSEESLLDSKSKEQKELEMKIDIIKYIVDKKKAENTARRDKALIDAQIKGLEAILGDKEQDELKNKSPEEIRQMLAALRVQKEA
jgi:uncharacterized protein YcbK (DUF882 family)